MPETTSAAPKAYAADYIGCATVDRWLSPPMLPWIIAQIHRGPNRQKVKMSVEGGCVVGYRWNCWEDCAGSSGWRQPPLFSHPLHLLAKLMMYPGDVVSFIYIIRDLLQPLLYIHLFHADDPEQVMELFGAMREQSGRTTMMSSSGQGVLGGRNHQPQPSANLAPLYPDISPSSSHFFEVLYIGKIKVSHKKVPDTFIDDALDKFHKLEKEKRQREMLNNNTQDNDGRIGILTTAKSESFGSTETLKTDSQKETAPKILMRKRSGSAGSVLNKKPENLSAASAAMQEHNRIMVFHVGRNDIRLISPDRKQVLLYKPLKDITYSIQGTKHSSHFAFICRETSTDPQSFIGYVFKCQSQSVADDVVTAINQALQSENSKVKPEAIVSCEHCPMVWYHKLCMDIEGLSDKASQAAILRRLELLPDDEQSIVQTKLQGALETGANLREQVELFMMILRAHCESKQSRHVHDTPENRHEFLNHYLGGGTIFMKAKRSLTNSFDQLLKRKGSRDDFSPILKELSLPANALLCKDSSNSDGSDSPKDSGSSQENSCEEKTGSMMNIFLKVGNSPSKSCTEDNDGEEMAPNHTASWRQAIFNTVVTPSKTLQEPVNVKRDKDFYRTLWKKAINQQVLLIRMERENARLTARQEEANVKRVKLEYDDLGVKENSDLWDSAVNKDLFTSNPKLLARALKHGVPKGKRGEVWMYLAEKHSNGRGGTGSSSPPAFDPSNFPNYNVSYESLLKQLTSHQHAILIDLGRTFPNHVYYSSPLGTGQLALFNLLKAYSLIDPEVGYCQGLSFIAGILLLHVSEEQAFVLLKHLMFCRGLRSRYLPDMAALQVNLYQLSRLLHDHHPQLYAHLDKYEVSPTLYAAPWLLTIFASQFPLGFVTRIFDVIFMESTDVLFRVALVLLGFHENGILSCDSFELIMDYMKNKVPNIDRNTMDKIMAEVLNRDISKELNEYGVEYHILQEEMSTPRPEAKRLKQLEAANKSLTDQNRALTQQLQIATSNINRLETSRSTYMSQMNRMESQIRSLEVSVSTLGEFIASLAYSKETSDVEIPSEILRIVAQLNVQEQRRGKRHDRNTNHGHSPPPPPPLKVAHSSPNLTNKVTSFFAVQNKSQKLTTLYDTDDSDSVPLKKSLSDTTGGGNVRELVVKSKSSDKLRDYTPQSSVCDFGRVLNDADMKALGLTSDDDSSASSSLTSHPLMLSDSDVRVSFEGTTKLKSIRTGSRSSSSSTIATNSRNTEHCSTAPDPLELKIIEPNKDSVGDRLKSAMNRVHSLFDGQDKTGNEMEKQFSFKRELAEIDS